MNFGWASSNDTMIICSPIGICAKNAVCLSGHAQLQMGSSICSVLSRGTTSSCCFYLCPGRSASKINHAGISVRATSSSSSAMGYTFRGSCFGSSSKQNVNLRFSAGGPQRTRFDISLAYQTMNIRLLVPKRKVVPKIKCNVGPITWPKTCASTGLIFGLLFTLTIMLLEYLEMVDVCSGLLLMGLVYNQGNLAPTESLQRELADDLRSRVADEFIKRRKETEWFVEGDFDMYVSQIRKPHVWGGEPELLMASHVLQMPITVYMHDEESGGLISIAEYGQEYGKENPIRVLYHGFGHYDALEIPGRKGAKSRL
ncbi:OTU domain containing protein [Quillaja saponaria]|uniref:Ubiquitin thioesterase OTU n=1 Tax=Quillaja saponaria TaxID=32244 RepID=A0AAD7VDX7_QUISA|nr:OTU domain containing protein [Quillaja saponaria]